MYEMMSQRVGVLKSLKSKFWGPESLTSVNTASKLYSFARQVWWGWARGKDFTGVGRSYQIRLLSRHPASPLGGQNVGTFTRTIDPWFRSQAF